MTAPEGYAVSLYRTAGSANPRTSLLIDGPIEISHAALAAALTPTSGECPGTPRGTP